MPLYRDNRPPYQVRPPGWGGPPITVVPRMRLSVFGMTELEEVDAMVAGRPLDKEPSPRAVQEAEKRRRERAEPRIYWQRRIADLEAARSRIDGELREARDALVKGLPVPKQKW